MKISEKLAEMKRDEAELMRLYDLRDSVAKQSFRDMLITLEGETNEKIEEKRKDFWKMKKMKIDEINNKIDALTEGIISGKNLVNKKNIELGIDKNLAEIKYLRLELSRLMALIKSEYSDKIDPDLYELDISERIKRLEQQKSKLDAEIQKANWTEKCS